jgi:diguanylate cyclase (GGDEF)-like protein
VGVGALLLQLAVVLVLAAAAVWRGEPLLAAGWAAAGGCCALGLYLRTRRDYEAQAAGMAALRAKADALSKELAQLKTRGLQTEREQKETLVLYGLVKGLAEALSWDDIKPKLESAVDQYLGVTDYALYAAKPQPKGQFRLLSVRRLEASPGSTWASLERFLQENGLTTSQARKLERPERAVALPIQEDGEILGYFYARVPAGADADALLTKANAFAQQVSFAFRRVRLFQEVESLSEIDGLTGVYRRGGFDERLKQEVVRARTFKTTFGLMLLDIDHFKRLNDRYGHPFGDQVLKRVGELLNASVYDTDFVARYGGEEFAVILPRAEAAGALRKAEAIRHAVEAEKFTLGFDTVQVTISIGVAQFPRDASAPEELVAQADAALYEAKEQGRNRVVDVQTIRR